ncbi:MAG: 1-(5-phosphoribosyl)-5-[(5-phosphoribosylamino)methylideneamino]imidazole-4-carboxamide isomerase [Bacteroidetes bacterium]|nr:1-(5-phosphoribosyl)-5-[(5-phosphoribosylamino)methylideneamino]imidazole-4-carboxamide isomerase [Bacteroidota bacterium]MBS1755877.1 1-(5-phosphoribosyl)-5-[(5-phosphoribosylamino)methylideneamino]imidazole-4-carboxamide isomerase [Bacteroidota bacterium]
MKIIPAIDIMDGKCVRLTQGDFSRQKMYSNNPVEVAKSFEDAGFERLHLVDLDGAKKGAIQNISVLKNITDATSLQVDFGGGIKSAEDIAAVLENGAALVTIGSLAVKQPALLAGWIKIYGTKKFFIGADVYDEKIKIRGWLEDGGIDIFTFLSNMKNIGATQFFCTDIKKDGAMQGPSIELYKKMIQHFDGISLTASGGVTTLNDLHLLQKIGCSGAIVGKAIYEQTISLTELSTF